MTVYGYIRVSTDKQTTKNQRFEIERFFGGLEYPLSFWLNFDEIMLYGIIYIFLDTGR